ncbi:hypothetical protein CSX04_01713 [Burkholderia cepacia]|nr:hypothetical protein CSX04_01713 [Burkholderia cepacia]
MNGPARSHRTAPPEAFAQGTGQRNRASGTRAPMHIVLFGAGHVGHALVTLLGALPCVVQWVDTRDELFPDECPPNVQPERPTRRRPSSTRRRPAHISS